MAPVLVSLIENAVGNPLKKPDVTVDVGAGYWGYGAEGETIYPVVSVYNAGDATSESCYVYVTDMQTHKDLVGASNVFNVSPQRPQIAQLAIQVPKVPKGQVWDTRNYIVRVECSNDVSPNSYASMKFTH